MSDVFSAFTSYFLFYNAAHEDRLDRSRNKRHLITPFGALSSGMVLVRVARLASAIWSHGIPLHQPSNPSGACFLVGVIYFSAENYWLLYFQLLLFAAVVIGMAGVFAGYFALYHFLTRKLRSNSLKIFCAFFLWIGIQFLIRMTSITTAAFEAPFYGPLEFFQIAAITDYSVFGALILSIGLAVALLIKERSKSALFWVILLAGCLGGLYVWGHHRLQSREQGMLKVALIQPNLPMSGMWRLDHPDEIRNRYRDLALKAAASKPALIIFPLYTFPDDPLRNREFFLGLAKEIHLHILAASHIPEIPGESVFKNGYKNVAVLYAPDGKVTDHYQSVQKAPSFSPVEEHRAKTYKVLNSPFGKLGILLCYEDTKSKYAGMAKREGAKYLIALSNPGFFSKTHMPYYHLIQDRLRAIETGLPLLRVSSNGYSANIDRVGRLIKRSRLNEEEIILAQV